MHRMILTSLIALFGLAMPASAVAAPSTGAVVFSKSTTVDGVAKGGLFAVRDGRLNQLTEDPTDTEPAFAADGRTIAFARGGDLYSVRPDGSGQRRLTSGPELDSAPIVSPDGRTVVFERRSGSGPADLHKVRIHGGGLRTLTTGAADDHDAEFAADGRALVFVRGLARSATNSSEDLFSIRPSGAGLARLTRTAVDEFEPRYFAGGIVFSRGESTEGPAAYADVYTMRRNGTKMKPQVRGVGSAYVEDVSADGHTLLFRRSQGLWAKRIGPGQARKLAQLPDQSETNGVFSSDGRRIAAFVADEERQQLVSIDLRTRRQSELAEGFEVDEKDGTAIGPVIAWQPVR